MDCAVCHHPSHCVLDPVSQEEFEAVVSRFGVPPISLCENCFGFLDEQEPIRGLTEN